MFTVKINGEEKVVYERTTYEQLVEPYQGKDGQFITLIASDGKLRELFKRVNHDCEITLFTMRDDAGYKTYVRTATMLFMKAVCDLFGFEAAAKCKMEYAIGHGIFLSAEGAFPSGEETAKAIHAKMHELVKKKEPFLKRSLPIDDAIEIFEKQGMEDKVKLFRYRRTSAVNVYECDGYYDYNYGYMMPNTGYVKWFNVIAYEDGFMLLLPTQKNPDNVAPFDERRKLFETLRESDEWGKQVGIETVGDLNEKICEGTLHDMVLVQEAMQERRISEIARDIVAHDNVKFVMIAGPSSSGKTSLSHRLSIQLRTLGKTPHPIAMDNYFVNREDTPLDEKGDYDFECLGAMDIELFNSDMLKLLSGECVQMPTFNFKIGKREYLGNTMQLGPDDILVIEGIHGLNPKMSYALPNESKYKVYVSALTTINVDAHNRISTTDGRLLRRLVRDARTRGSDAKRTIQMWGNVRKGEEENIFPFQEEADAIFNSALIYELAVIKQYAEPLLFQVPKNTPEYYEAKRLLKFLDYFLNITGESIPNNSICREFVGGSYFNV
ncbi:MAG: nucleoside kinase [Lachnospiraceae bacterium]|nr:nucleoside kinase [Lachnospiraceae bacterium]